jgi:sialate O-acetylesterase
MNRHVQGVAVLFVLMGMVPAQARVTLPAIFGDRTVVQQNTELVVWGWARPLEEVAVTGSWDRKSDLHQPKQ